MSLGVTQSALWRAQVMDPLTLTSQLNALLQAIHLPFVLESPVDLTPSLLLAVLESILNVRIPIAHVNGDEHHDDDGRVTPSQQSHIQTIKIVLGVLETDILQIDVGLSKLDPRLLAAGAWDEVVYVAEVLCWIGEELGLLQPVPTVDKGEGKVQSAGLVPPPVKAPTPSPSSTITFLPAFSEASPPPTPTTTSLLFATDLEDHTLQTNITSPLVISSPLNPSPRNDRSRTHSTHLSPPATPARHRSMHSQLHTSIIPRDDSSFSRQTPPIRKTGYISLVDHDSELSSFFERSLSISSSSSTPSSQRRTGSQKKSRSSRNTRAISPPVFPYTPSTPPRRSNEKSDWRTLLSTSPDHDPRRTYELLQQRTELMEELLRIRMSQRRPIR